MAERDEKRQVAKITVFITSIFVILSSITYAYISQVLTGTKEVVINAGVLDLVLEEENAITISDALPMHDAVGMIQEDVFVFRLVNKTSNPTNYILKLSKINADNELSPSDVKYYLTKEGVGQPKLLSTLPSDGTVDSGTIAGGDTIDYTLRLWIDSGVKDLTAIEGKSLSYKLNVDVSQVIEENIYSDESGAETPQLTSGMIPVMYNGSNWVKADTSKEWYDYEKQNWANSVTVTESSRDTYMALDAGEPISMDDINTMWVWIPRYEYQYTDLGTSYAGGTQTQPGEIKVNFVSKDTTTPSDSNVYHIAEGFKFGDENIAGFWMAKFELSTLQTCTAGSTNNVGCDLTNLTPQIKPNVTSWRGARLSTFFQTSRLMQSTNDTLNYNASTYGFDIEGTSSMDVHVVKNTEWGAVAMLAHSKYGKYGNSSYTGVNKEVYQNKSSTYITGMSNGTPSGSSTNTQKKYNVVNTGYGASTTGTIYGVYDMSGGSWEYTMGNYNSYSGYNVTSNSGFCGTNGPASTDTCVPFPEPKYYDLYTSNVAADAYKFGDATYETSKWYKDNGGFVGQNPWAVRSGNYSSTTSAGLYNMSATNGQAGAQYSTRFVIKK